MKLGAIVTQMVSLFPLMSVSSSFSEEENRKNEREQNSVFSLLRVEQSIHSTLVLHILISIITG